MVQERGGCDYLKPLVATCSKKLENLKDVSEGDMLAAYVSKLSTTANWGRLGRDKSQNLQLLVAAYHLLVYTIFLLQVIVWPTSNHPEYHPDPTMLRVGGIIALISGAAGFVLQLLLPKILRLVCLN